MTAPGSSSPSGSAPDVVIRFELSVTGAEAIERSGNFDGTLRWATDDGRRDSCRIDLEVATTLGESGFSVNLTGHACGLRIMESEPGLFDI